MLILSLDHFLSSTRNHSGWKSASNSHFLKRKLNRLRNLQFGHECTFVRHLAPKLWGIWGRRNNGENASLLLLVHSQAAWLLLLLRRYSAKLRSIVEDKKRNRKSQLQSLSLCVHTTTSLSSFPSKCSVWTSRSFISKFLLHFCISPSCRGIFF